MPIQIPKLSNTISMQNNPKTSKKTRSKPVGSLGAFISRTPATDYLNELGTSGTDPSEESSVLLLISTHKDMREQYTRLLAERMEFNEDIQDLEDDLDAMRQLYQEAVDELTEIDEEYYQLPKWYRWLVEKIESFLSKKFKGNPDYEPYKD